LDPEPIILTRDFMTKIREAPPGFLNQLKKIIKYLIGLMFPAMARYVEDRRER